MLGLCRLIDSYKILHSLNNTKYMLELPLHISSKDTLLSFIRKATKTYILD